MVLGPDRAVVGHARADHGDGLAPQDGAAAVGPRSPVDGVLELAGHRAVELRRGEQDRVGARDRVAQPRDLGRREVGVAVLVVGRERVEPVVELDLDALGGQLGGRPQQRRVVRRCAQAAGDRRGSASVLRGLDGRDADEELDLVGDEEVAVGSVWFHFRSKSRRSIVPSTSNPMRSLPHGSLPFSATVPVSSIGLVMPLIVISPASRILPSAVGSSAGGVEGDLRGALGVEEVGRLQVARRGSPRRCRCWRHRRCPAAPGRRRWRRACPAKRGTRRGRSRCPCAGPRSRRSSGLGRRCRCRPGSIRVRWLWLTCAPFESEVVEDATIIVARKIVMSSIEGA